MRQRSKNGERELISSLRHRVVDPKGEGQKPFGRRGNAAATLSSLVILGIGDDCAILRPPSGSEVLVTTDFTLETVHFRREWHTPESVGHRCLARGLSDLAAMGAEPMAAFLSLALPVELIRSRAGRLSWRERFLDGFLALAERYNVPLAGGDTAQSPKIQAVPALRNSPVTATGFALMDIVLVGTAKRGRALRRSSAKPGDRIYVTGWLGGAAAELSELAKKPRRFDNVTRAMEDGEIANPHPQLFPEPRLTVGRWLVKNRRANSAIDISDGLSTDLDHLCEESRLAATIDADAIPVHPIARRIAGSEVEKGLQFALHGGEDYELLFTASPKLRIPRSVAGVPVTCIGEMRANISRIPRVQLIEMIHGRQNVRAMPPGGWEHFT